MKLISVQTRFKVVLTFLLVCWMVDAGEPATDEEDKEKLKEEFGKEFRAKFEEKFIECECLSETSCQYFQDCINSQVRLSCDEIFMKYGEKVDNINCENDQKKFEFLRCGVSLLANLDIIESMSKKKYEGQLRMPEMRKPLIENPDKNVDCKNNEKLLEIIRNYLKSFSPKKCLAVLTNFIHEDVCSGKKLNIFQMLTVDKMVNFGNKIDAKKYPELLEPED